MASSRVPLVRHGRTIRGPTPESLCQSRSDSPPPLLGLPTPHYRYARGLLSDVRCLFPTRPDSLAALRIVLDW